MSSEVSTTKMPQNDISQKCEGVTRQQNTTLEKNCQVFTKMPHNNILKRYECSPYVKQNTTWNMNSCKNSTKKTEAVYVPLNTVYML